MMMSNFDPKKFKNEECIPPQPEEWLKSQTQKLFSLIENMFASMYALDAYGQSRNREVLEIIGTINCYDIFDRSNQSMLSSLLRSFWNGKDRWNRHDFAYIASIREIEKIEAQDLNDLKERTLRTFYRMCYVAHISCLNEEWFLEHGYPQVIALDLCYFYLWQQPLGRSEDEDSLDFSDEDSY